MCKIGTELCKETTYCIVVCSCSRGLWRHRLLRAYQYWVVSEWKFFRYEVFTAVTMKNAVFWVVTPCGSCNNRRFGEYSVSFIRMRIDELVTTLALTINRDTQRWYIISSRCASAARRFLSPWWWRDYFLPKPRFLREHHGVITQKTANS
jgi:hypothetical protein